MRHAFVPRGSTVNNPKPAPDATTYIKPDGSQAPIRQPKVDGLVFGFMESPNGRVITHIDEIALPHRIPLDQERHLSGGGMGPNGSRVAEAPARLVVEDAIFADKALMAEISAKLGKIRGDRPPIT